jgi:hypothetical protein
MTTAYSDIRASADLAAAEATLKANIGPLRDYRTEPTPTQIAAVVAVAGVIVTATKQQAGWARLRLKALRSVTAPNRSLGLRRRLQLERPEAPVAPWGFVEGGQKRASRAATSRSKTRQESARSPVGGLVWRLE